MNTIDNEKSTVTKRDLATRVRLALKPDIKLHQAQVAEVISQTLDAIRDALVNGSPVELRNFGVFKIEVRKERCIELECYAFDKQPANDCFLP